MLDRLLSDIAAMSGIEAVAVVLAIAYLVLAVRQNILCWPAALVSASLYVAIFYDARLYMESALNVFYAAMAVYGWRQWRYGGAAHQGIRISTWTPARHIVVLALIATLTLIFGFALRDTDAALPFADSFTTVAAVFTTYMVACKILENWLYWFVIDSVSVYLYLDRELNLTVFLFAIYLVLCVVGFRAWRRDWRAGQIVLAPGV